MTDSDYRSTDCPNCGRHRVMADGICEKCEWDVDGGNYLSVTRPDEYERRHFGSADHWEGVFDGK